jgi:hypothetical protein
MSPLRVLAGAQSSALNLRSSARDSEQNSGVRIAAAGRCTDSRRGGVALDTLVVALRAIWWRRGISLAVLLIATFAAGVAAAGPVYLAASGDSIS